MSTSKPVNIIATIQPVDSKGKRKVSVSAAPDGEMPVIRTGLYSDLHRLIDELWIEVNTRKAQTVKGKTGSVSKAAKKKRTNRSGPVKEIEAEEPETESPEPATEAPATVEPSADTEEDQLPLIEGDPING